MGRGVLIILSGSGIDYIWEGENDFTEEVIVMNEGEIAIQGPKEEVQESPWFFKINEAIMRNRKKADTIESPNKRRVMTKSFRKRELISIQKTRGRLIRNKLERLKESSETASFANFNKFVKSYIGYPYALFVFSIVMVGVVVEYIAYIRLTEFSILPLEAQKQRSGMLAEVLLIFLTITIFNCIREFISNYFGKKLSLKIHSIMVYKTLHCSIYGVSEGENHNYSKVISTPKILNRFSNDLQVIDKEMNFYSYYNLIVSYAIFHFVFYVYLSSLYMSIAVFVTFVFALYSCSVYIRIKNVFLEKENESKTPFLNYLSDVIDNDGLPSIKASKSMGFVEEELIKLIDNVMKVSIIKHGVDMWFRIRIFFTCVFFMFVPIIVWIWISGSDDDTSTSFTLFSIAIFNLYNLPASLEVCLENYSKIEKLILSTSRCLWFKDIEEEGGYRSEGGDDVWKKEAWVTMKDVHKGDQRSVNRIKEALKVRAESNLMSLGNLEFENVNASYSGFVDPIIKGLSFKLNKGEKLGIIGRTGSGKSTLVKLIWGSLRPISGKIKLGDKELSTYSLEQLRSSLSVLTQETAIFPGTLKRNLDMGIKRSREELREVLDRIGFNNLGYRKKGLDMEIKSEGGNLSEGEKQLIQIARLVIERRSLVILDEATSFLDINTEEEVLKVLKAEIEAMGATLVVVGHKLGGLGTLGIDKVLALGDEIIDDDDMISKGENWLLRRVSKN